MNNFTFSTLTNGYTCHNTDKGCEFLCGCSYQNHCRVYLDDKKFGYNSSLISISPHVWHIFFETVV